MWFKTLHLILFLALTATVLIWLACQFGSTSKLVRVQAGSQVETLEALDSPQPLVRSLRNHKLGNGESDPTFDDESSATTSSGSSISTTTTSPAPQISTGSVSKFDEREIEEMSDRMPADEFDPIVRRFPMEASSSSSMGPGPAFMGPILNSIFSEMGDLGSLFRSAMRSNGTQTTGPNGRPTIVKKLSKNGATIIISSTGSALNDSSLQDPQSSLLEKLLPPMFGRSTSVNINGTNSTDSTVPFGGLTSATITISGSDMGPFPFAAPMGSAGMPSPFAALPPPLGWSRFSNHGGMFGGSMDAFGGSSSRLQPSVFVEPMRGPFIHSAMGPFGSPFQAPILPPPGLLGMLMRANSMQDQEDLNDLPVASQSQSQSSNKTNVTDTLSAQASQQQAINSNNQTITNDGNSTATNKTSTLDPEVETFDVAQLLASKSRMRQLYGMRPRPSPMGGSMLIFSSGQMDAGRPMSSPFGFAHSAHGFMGPPAGPMMSPFLIQSASSPPPSPHMVLLDGSGEQSGQGEMNPLVRAMLSSVMSDLAERKQVSSSERKRADSRSADSSWGELDDDWASDSSDEPASKSPRSRSRSSNEDTNDMNSNGDFNQAEAAEQYIAGLHENSSIDRSSDQASPFEGGLVSGTIRQTIRGPNGITSERIIEIPASRNEQVESGIRSQSLSRADFDESSSVEVPMRPTSMHPAMFGMPFGSPFRPSQSDESFPMSHPVGIIGRLLSNLSRRVNVAGETTGPQVMKSRSMESDSEDPDELPTGGQVRLLQSGSEYPKVRVASARIKMSPMTIAKSRSSAIFMAPTRLTIPAGDDSADQVAKSSARDAKLASSVEDTLNSVEDRLNNVFSAAQQVSSSHPNHRSDEQEVPKSLADNQAHKQQPAHMAKIIRANAFTSPSSPLFGFPQPSRFAAEESQAEGESSESNRKPRAFVYHSNHELASGEPNKSQAAIAAGQTEEPRSVNQKASNSQLQPFQMIGRANRMVDSPPAAELVMGRRADDSPAESIFAAASESSDHHQRSARDTRASKSDNYDDEKYTTIVI